MHAPPAPLVLAAAGVDPVTVATIVLAAATAVLAVVTYLLVRESGRTRRESKLPVVICAIKQEEVDGRVVDRFFVRNVGTGPALGYVNSAQPQAAFPPLTLDVGDTITLTRTFMDEQVTIRSRYKTIYGEQLETCTVFRRVDGAYRYEEEYLNLRRSLVAFLLFEEPPFEH